jgi:serine/threonine-protein kinase RsbW
MAETAHRTLTIPSDTAYLAQVRKAVLDVAARARFPTSEAHLVALAVDEAIANIIEHAYASGRGGRSQEVQICLEAGPVRFRAVIRDAGLQFDPTKIPSLDIKSHIARGAKGGLGIYIIRRIMDQICYSYLEGKYNELLLIKGVDNQGGRARSPS